jgi:hypothetical protein
MKRLLIFLLIIAMVLPVAVACGKTEDTSVDQTTAAEQTTTAATEATTTVAQTNEYEIGDAMPEDLNFEGKEITILSRGRDWCKDEISVNEINGDLVNDAVFNRNAAVESRLNVKIVNHMIAGTGDYEIVDLMRKQVPSGSSDYDVIVGPSYADLSGVPNNLYQNLLEVEHLDLSRPYWAQGFNEAMTIGEGQYLATGAACLSFYRFVFATFFNKEMFDESNVPYLYDAVNNGTWTLDYQAEISQAFYSDLNGNGASDEGDIFGFALNHDEIGVDPYWAAFELPILTKDADNFLVFSPDVERLTNVISKLNNFVWNSQSVYRVLSYGSDDEQLDLAEMFSENTAAMTTLRLIEVEGEYLRDMKALYGIVPMPKFDEAQAAYHSHVHDNVSAYSIPLTTVGEELTLVGAVMESMAAESYRMVMPAYYELALKTKYVSDEESVQMLDLVIDSLHVDAGFLFVDDTAQFHQSMRKRWIGVNNSDVASVIKSLERVVQKQITNLNNSIEKNQG